MGNSGSHNFSVTTDYQLFEYTKSTLAYISLVLTILGLVMVAILHYRNQNSVEDAHSLMQ